MCQLSLVQVSRRCSVGVWCGGVVWGCDVPIVLGTSKSEV